MVHIEKDQWFSDVYGRALYLMDVLRHPEPTYSSMSSDEKDRFRQTQCDVEEVVRILGTHLDFALVMKWDGVIGWVPAAAVNIDADIHAYIPVESLGQSSDVFFQYWYATPYIWGGITRAGIDCSGFTQRYYYDVLAKSIPKNSYDQRRLGRSKKLAEVVNHDLIFCTRKGGRGIQHVGIYFEGNVWHAHSERGVTCQSMTEFLADYEVLQVAAIVEG